MGEQKSQKSGPPPWHIPLRLEEVPEAGRHFELVADAAVRAAVARVANLRDLPRFAASFDVTRRGADGLHVSGSVSATVEQTCVVTLEPLVNEIDETVDLTFVPRSAAEAADADAKPEPRDVRWDDPEPLLDGKVDLGGLAVEFLILGLDPYPRKADAIFEPPQEDVPDPGPFAALAKFTKD